MVFHFYYSLRTRKDGSFENCSILSNSIILYGNELVEYNIYE